MKKSFMEIQAAFLKTINAQIQTRNEIVERFRTRIFSAESSLFDAFLEDSAATIQAFQQIPVLIELRQQIISSTNEDELLTNLEDFDIQKVEEAAALYDKCDCALLVDNAVHGIAYDAIEDLLDWVDREIIQLLVDIVEEE